MLAAFDDYLEEVAKVNRPALFLLRATSTRSHASSRGRCQHAPFPEAREVVAGDGV